MTYDELNTHKYNQGSYNSIDDGGDGGANTEQRN